MARKLLIRSQGNPYHVTIRANNRELFPIDPFAIWKVFCDLFFETHVLFRTQPHAFVMMPNHIHLLITTPQEDLGKVMQHWIGSGTRTVNLISGRSGRIFGARYHWTLIDNPIYFMHAFKYVYRNPVKANLCAQAQLYPFSTLQFALGTQITSFPIWYAFQQKQWIGIPNTDPELLEWINTPFISEHEKAIQLSLKRTRFETPKIGRKRTPFNFGVNLPAQNQ